MNFEVDKKEKYIIFFFWIFIFLVLWLQAVVQVESILESILYVGLLIVSVAPISNYLSGHLLQVAIRNKSLKKYCIQFCLFSLPIGLISFTYSYLFHYLEVHGVFPISEYFNITSLILNFIVVFLSAGIIINTAICGLRFFLEYIKSQKKIVEYQLQTLQHQVTPHFMFNVLNHIHILMQTDVELASDLLIKYSDILRYQLYNGDKQTVTLEQDIQFLKDFIAVEEIRWQGKLTVSCSWRIENVPKEIPALLFITFVENAFKYVSKSDFEKGYIKIDLEEKNNKISFTLENSKSTLPSTKAKEGGIGLKNIKERLEILYFDKYDLLIEESDTTYTTKLVINT